jgi:hypothetical protein
MMAKTFSRNYIAMASFDDSVHVAAVEDGLTVLDVWVIPEVSADGGGTGDTGRGWSHGFRERFRGAGHAKREPRPIGFRARSN